MGINYGDTGMIINYIQMFLKEYYSKFIKIEHSYSKEIQDNIINYINSPDSVTMRELCNDILPKQYKYYGDLLTCFNKEEKIDEVYFESRLTNYEINFNKIDEELKEFPVLNSSEAASWIYQHLKDFEFFILKYGWNISNFNYNNKNNKCDITIKKMNKNVLPKSALIDLINMFDKKYTEICFAKSEHYNSNTGNKYHETYFSTLYNFEIKNYENKYLEDKTKYKLYIPSFNNKYTVNRNLDGTYDVIKDADTDNSVTIIEDFKGLSTFTSNIYVDKNGKDQYYVIYIKRPLSYNELSKNNELYVYVNLSENVGNKVNINNSTSNNELESVQLSMIRLDINTPSYNKDGLFYIILCKVPGTTSAGNYKLCVSLYDPDNEIDTILSFKLDENYLNKNEIYNGIIRDSNSCWLFDYEKLCPINSDKTTLSSINFIDPYSYYLSPYILHKKFISYILEAIVHEYSREDDIILIQKIANKLGFSYDSTSLGEYTESLKKFIINIQNNQSNGENPILYGKGYVDSDTEFIINLKGGNY